MKKVLIACVLLANVATAQKFATRNGKISFFSTTPVENIEAVNNNVGAAIDAATGSMAWQLLIKGFTFENSMMQEHFNENYMESDKFPKAEFSGKVTEPASIDYKKDGTYNVKVTGKLTIHGVTKDVGMSGTITIKGGAVTVHSKFKVRTADFDIKIPTLVVKKVAEIIEVTVDATLNPAK